MQKRAKNVAILATAGGAVLIISALLRSRSSSQPDASSGGRPARRGRTEAPKEGVVVCPAEVGFAPAPVFDIAARDFVALRLSDPTGAFSEMSWGVIERIEDQSMVVRLTGILGRKDIRLPQHEKHGFDVGSVVTVPLSCAWEVFHTTEDGMALCGMQGVEVAGHPPPSDASDAGPGDEVLLYLAPVRVRSRLIAGPGWDVPNPVWARIMFASKSVLRVLILGFPPAPSPALKLGSGDQIDVTRDCVFDVRRIGSIAPPEVG